MDKTTKVEHSLLKLLDQKNQRSQRSKELMTPHLSKKLLHQNQKLESQESNKRRNHKTSPQIPTKKSQLKLTHQQLNQPQRRNLTNKHKQNQTTKRTKRSKRSNNNNNNSNSNANLQRHLVNHSTTPFS